MDTLTFDLTTVALIGAIVCEIIYIVRAFRNL